MAEEDPSSKQADQNGGKDASAKERPRTDTRKESTSVYAKGHDLREVYTRENVDQRRRQSHTLRRFLTTKQDKQVMNKMVRIRDEYVTMNNDDVVLVWAKQMIEDGKGNELDPELIVLATQANIPRREGDFEPEEEAAPEATA